jgi:hypothetical protein
MPLVTGVGDQAVKIYITISIAYVFAVLFQLARDWVQNGVHRG